MEDGITDLPSPSGKEAGADVPVAPKEDLYVIEAIDQYRRESEDAKLDRIRKNRTNRDVYLGRQDFSHKQEGQSAEFLPKVAIAVEQMTSFVKKGLVQFGDWFSVDLDNTLSDKIDGTQVRALIKPFLDNLWVRNSENLSFPTVMGDAVKLALMESLIILKVHGGMQVNRKFAFERTLVDGVENESLKTDERQEWRLRIDLVRPEDYFPDPTGNNLYEIQRCERDLHEIIAGAEEGLYDEAAVKMLIDTDFPQPQDEKRTDESRNQPETTSPGFRKRVMLDEFWGTILKSDGTIAHRNVVCTVANGKYLIRKPEPNPFWHQESPFVVAPLIRVPFSVWHKALYDHASDLNVAINEVFNLMLDGGMAAVWGVKQLRIEDLEDPNQVSGGLKQGMTLAVKQTLPHNAKVVETVATGDVPNDAMAVFEALQREFNHAVLTNELKLGQMPSKQVLATEVIEANQSNAVTLDGIIADLEMQVMVPTLRKAWLTILQNADAVPESAIAGTIDKRIALFLMRASPEERFSLFAGRTQFRVSGLSATMARAQDFQKMMAMLQATTTNPLMFAAFMKKFSPDKTLRKLMRTLNINPGDVEKSGEEEKEAPQDQAMMQQVMMMLGGAKGGISGGGGDPDTAAANQLVQPASGLPPNA